LPDQWVQWSAERQVLSLAGRAFRITIALAGTIVTAIGIAAGIDEHDQKGPD
jgi:hypothetical protein